MLLGTAQNYASIIGQSPHDTIKSTLLCTLDTIMKHFKCMQLTLKAGTLFSEHTPYKNRLIISLINIA